MNDIDLINFIELIENSPKVNTEFYWDFDSEFRTRDIYGVEGWASLKIDKTSLELTIEKLKRTGALSFGQGGLGSVGNALGAFMFTDFTKSLYEVIKATGIK
ncbi:hypothetical protein [Adhaeribacter arboris]|nr:hypothetical protein [Adhaeribacter arboris]